MSECSVFECGICTCAFDDKERIPLSLPCGHVFCKSCMTQFWPSGGVVCPHDKSQFPIKLENLPYCYAILTNIPKTKIVKCSKHPRKNIKFICNTHQQYMCSDWVLEHTGAGHDVTAFTVTYQELKSELQTLVESSSKTVNELRFYMQSQHMKDKQLMSFYETQIRAAQNTYDKAIHKLQMQKKSVSDNLRRHLMDQQNNMEKFKYQKTKQLESSIQVFNEFKAFGDDIENKTYEEYLAFCKSTANTFVKLESPQKFDSEVKFYAFNSGLSVTDNSGIAQVKSTEIEEAWNCGKCQMLNKQISSVCSQCGHSRTQQFEGEEELWKCKHCFHNNQLSAAYCGFCRQVREESPRNLKPSQVYNAPKFESRNYLKETPPSKTQIKASSRYKVQSKKRLRKRTNSF